MTGLNQASGVDYDALDEFKLTAQRFGRQTEGNLRHFKQHGVELVPYAPSRGESAFLIRNGDHYLAHLHEGLGTKNLVPDSTGSDSNDWYRCVGHDTAAMGVNDVLTVGALPVSITMHLAVGDTRWLARPLRPTSVAEGFANAADLAGCIWSAGETPQLPGIIESGTVELSCSVLGRTIGLEFYSADRVRAGDAIVFCESSGIHANGLSKAREIAPQLANGYGTRLPGAEGQTYGDALMTPTHIYANLIELAIRHKLHVHYAVNVTGHGWRKLMRAPQPLTYVIRELPAVRPIFPFLQQVLDYNDLTMFSSYNMGVGFALFVNPAHVERLLELARRAQLPYRVFEAGRVEEGPKHVFIEPLKLPLPGDSLNIR